MHDLSAHFVSRFFRDELGDPKIPYPERVAIVFDHTFSPPTESSARTLRDVRAFAKSHSIENLFDSGSGSLHHVILESGLWAPGRIIVGCDSHTTVYGALGVFSTGIGNDSMAALGLAHGKGWFKTPACMQVRLDGTLAECVSPRDVAQFLVKHLGEDGAVSLSSNRSSNSTGSSSSSPIPRRGRACSSPCETKSGSSTPSLLSAVPPKCSNISPATRTESLSPTNVSNCSRAEKSASAGRITPKATENAS